MTESPELQTRPAQPYVGLRATVTMATMPTTADRIEEVVDGLVRQGVEPTGAPMLRYLVIDMDADLVVEAAVPVATDEVAASAAARIDGAVAAETPAGRYAVLHHRGHPDELVGATAELLRWAEAQGLAWDVEDSPAGQRWGCRLEVYLSDPDEVPMTDWRTDLVFRLADRDAEGQTQKVSWRR